LKEAVMREGIVQEFLSSPEGSELYRELNEEEGLAPDKVEAAVEATVEGTIWQAGETGLDSPEGGPLSDALRELPSENGGALTAKVTEYVADHGFPRGVAEKVVQLALPKLLQMAHH
jgi:hypothetical protein